MLDLDIRGRFDCRRGRFTLLGGGTGFDVTIDLYCRADFTVTGRSIPAPLIIAQLDTFRISLHVARARTRGFLRTG